MSKAKSSQYFGSITAKQAAEGIKIARENALDLFAEAELLFKHFHYQRSLALAVLAIEEAGKESIIWQILMAKDSKTIKAAWRDYRSHTKKNLMWVFEMYFHEGARKLEDFRPIFDETNDHGFQLEKVKQLAFYTDAHSNCRWSWPKKNIDKELAENILSIAKRRVRPRTKFSNSEKLLEICEKQAKLLPSKTLNDQKNILLAIYHEAEEKGALPKGSYKEMKQFIEIGI